MGPATGLPLVHSDVGVDEPGPGGRSRGPGDRQGEARRRQGRLRLAAASLAALAAISSPASAERRIDAGAAAARIVEQTNAFRTANERKPVARSTALTAAAQRFAEFMASTDAYGHEADGRKPAARAAAQGYAYCLVAENIAYQFSSSGFGSDDLAERLFQGWEESPGHRRNMVLPQVTDIGVGLAQSARTRRWYAVQMFGRPKSKSTGFQIANRADAPIRYELDDEAFTLAPRVTRTHNGCFGGPLRLRWPDGAEGPPLEPRNGARYVVERSPAGRWRLQTQAR